MEIPAVNLSGVTKSGSEVDFSGGTETVSQWHRYEVAGNSGQMVVTHTFMYNGKKLRNYTMLYDKSKKAALWSAFAMNKGTYPHLVSRGDSWNYDPAIEKSWQPRLNSSYSGSTYERGHQIASNDRRTTFYQMYQTDYFTNMTPQLGAFNSGDNTEWDELETAIQNRGYSISGSDTLYVVTGAIFEEGYKTDARDNDNKVCPVPTHYYKCIMKVSFSGGKAVSASGAAYLFEHKSDAAKQVKTIDELEALTGFDFFTNIPSSCQDAAERTVTNLL